LITTWTGRRTESRRRITRRRKGMVDEKEGRTELAAAVVIVVAVV
jgi:hypothetical protein